VRKLGVRVANLEFVAADQASLESWERSGDGFETDAGDGLSDEEPESDPNQPATTRQPGSRRSRISRKPALVATAEIPTVLE